MQKHSFFGAAMREYAISHGLERVLRLGLYHIFCNFTSMDNGFRERQDQSGLSANGVAADGNLDRLLEAITNGVHDAESAPGIHCSTSGSSWDVVAQVRALAPSSPTAAYHLLSTEARNVNEQSQILEIHCPS